MLVDLYIVEVFQTLILNIAEGVEEEMLNFTQKMPKEGFFGVGRKL